MHNRRRFFSQRVHFYHKRLIADDQGGAHAQWRSLGDFWAHVAPFGPVVSVYHHRGGGPAYQVTVQAHNDVWRAESMLWQDQAYRLCHRPYAATGDTVRLRFARWPCDDLMLIQERDKSQIQ